MTCDAQRVDEIPLVIRGDRAGDVEQLRHEATWVAVGDPGGVLGGVDLYEGGQ